MDFKCSDCGYEWNHSDMVGTRRCPECIGVNIERNPTEQGEGADKPLLSAVNQRGIIPGPWKIEETDRTENGLDLLIRGSKDEYIGWLYWQHENEGKLIAAAPDMYEVLLWIKENNDLRYINPIFTKLLNNALNKAEGKTVD